MGWIGIALVGLLPFPIAYDAVARSFGHPTLWVFETTLYVLVAAAFLANGIALAAGAHFRITMLGHFWPRAGKGLDIARCWSRLPFALTLIFATGAASFHTPGTSTISAPTRCCRFRNICRSLRCRSAGSL